jgi:hypothetical protein
MAGTLTVRITESQAKVASLRYRLIWSAWLDGRLLGQGHAFRPETAEAQALDLVADLLAPEEVRRIEVVRA